MRFLSRRFSHGVMIGRYEPSRRAQRQLDAPDRPRARAGRDRPQPKGPDPGYRRPAGITERTAQAIVADLEAAGYVARTRVGRRTRYTVNRDSLFRHPAQEGHRVGPFLALLATARDDTAPQQR
jgi:hypothetical protein